MALRIGGGMPPVPDPTTPVEEPAALPPEAAPMDAMPPMDMPMESGGGFIDPESARYFGPESRCMGCIHYMDPGACEIVSGPIDPQGVCMLYLPGMALAAEPLAVDPMAMPPDIGMEGMPAEDMPMEESPAAESKPASEKKPASKPAEKKTSDKKPEGDKDK